LIPVLETGALAAEIGIEPMASCASGALRNLSYSPYWRTEFPAMYNQVGAPAAATSRQTTTVRFVRGTWSPDAITERDRRDFEESLKAQAERLNRKSDVNRD